jgi:hypothetical protein
LSQELQMRSQLISEEDESIDPFADFVIELEGHLTGAPIADGYTVLTEQQTFLSGLDEKATKEIIESVAATLNIDISDAITSREALEVMVSGY